MGRAGSARALVVAALLGLVPLACHGDDGDTDGGSSTTGGGMNTDEVAGFWQIDLLGLGGGEVLRDGDPIALRGAVGPRGALAAFGVATLFALAARLSWRTALRHYSSASS